VPTARGPAWADHYSGVWAMTTVRAILVNPAYAGDMVWNRRTDARFHKIVRGLAVERHGVLGRRLEPNAESEWIVIKDAHEALVSRRLWELAQQLLAAKPAAQEQRGTNPRSPRKLETPDYQTPATAGHPKAKDVASTNDARHTQVPSLLHVGGGWVGPRARFLLSGLIRCAHCGHRYEGYTQRGKVVDPRGGGGGGGERSKTYYYACGGYIRHGKSICRLREIKQDLLEGLVIQAVLDFYAIYHGKTGEARLASALQTQVGAEGRQAVQERDAIARRIEEIDRTAGNLLDHMTPANRVMADRRLAELTAERERLETRTRTLDRLALGESERRELLKQTAAFVRSLDDMLIGGQGPAGLGDRQAALRRAVASIMLDRERGQARIAIRVLPVVAGGTAASPTREVVIKFDAGRAKRVASKKASAGTAVVAA